jgi:hypothetical protein
MNRAELQKHNIPFLVDLISLWGYMLLHVYVEILSMHLNLCCPQGSLLTWPSMVW